MKPAELKEALVGPIVSLPTFFTKDGAQDLESVCRTVEFCVTNGLKVMLLTMGDSNYASQSEIEIRALARAVIEQVDGRAIVLVGTSAKWWQNQIIDFARYVENLGADGVMVCRPSWALDSTPQEFEETIFEMYEAVAEAVKCGIVLQGFFSMKLLKRLVEIPSVVGLKEDAGDSWCHDALWVVGKKVAIFNGGQKWRFLYGVLWGMTGYLTTYGPLAPQVPKSFWDAVQRKDFFTAAQIVDKYDNPYFEYAIPHPKGFRAVRQAAFEVFGRGPRWLRLPQSTLDNCEMNELRSIFTKMGLL
jgi:dihydrodipicolinate synthase/N-acetylneuraminate lyase